MLQKFSVSNFKNFKNKIVFDLGKTCNYEFNENLIKKAYDEGVDTIVTCDNGIAAIEQIKYAKELGIEIFQTHGRLRICKNDPELDKICLEDARRDLLAAKALDCDQCVMHGVATGAMGPETPAEVMRELNFEIFCKMSIFFMDPILITSVSYDHY